MRGIVVKRRGFSAQRLQATAPARLSARAGPQRQSRRGLAPHRARTERSGRSRQRLPSRERLQPPLLRSGREAWRSRRRRLVPTSAPRPPTPASPAAPRDPGSCLPPLRRPLGVGYTRGDACIMFTTPAAASQPLRVDYTRHAPCMAHVHHPCGGDTAVTCRLHAACMHGPCSPRACRWMVEGQGVGAATPSSPRRIARLRLRKSPRAIVDERPASLRTDLGRLHGGYMAVTWRLRGPPLSART